MATPPLPPYAETLRARDPDRFFTALFAPPDRRDALFLLYAFNHEIARARDVASEPMLALIRLQWWREVVEGTPRRHELATPLLAALDAGRLDREWLGRMVEGREAEADEAIPTLEDWRGYVQATAGALAGAAAAALGADEAERGRIALLGAAYGVAGQLRNVSVLARLGRCLLPGDVLARHGLSAEAVTARPDHPALDGALADLRAVGLGWLAEAGGRMRRPLVAAALPAVLARRDLRGAAAPRTGLRTADRFAIVMAALRCRV